MSYFSNILIAQIMGKEREKKRRRESRKRKKFDQDRFECYGVNFVPLCVGASIFFAAILIAGIISDHESATDVAGKVYMFGVLIALCLGVAWADAHQKLEVNGDDAAYTNIWGIKRKFKFSEVTECKTTDLFIRLYAGKKRVAFLDKDMYCIKLLEERCRRDGITWESKYKSRISKVSLVWSSSRLLAWLFFWIFIILSIMLIPFEIITFGFVMKNIFEAEALIATISFLILTGIVLIVSRDLKEIRSIEVGLNTDFNYMMRQRAAFGKKYQDEEWFVEATPGKIEVLNRRFISKWYGIKKDVNAGATAYHIEFKDINGMKHKIGGHYKKYAESMDKWYKGGSSGFPSNS